MIVAKLYLSGIDKAVKYTNGLIVEPTDLRASNAWLKPANLGLLPPINATTSPVLGWVTTTAD